MTVSASLAKASPECMSLEHSNNEEGISKHMTVTVTASKGVQQHSVCNTDRSMQTGLLYQNSCTRSGQLDISASDMSCSDLCPVNLEQSTVAHSHFLASHAFRALRRADSGSTSGSTT